MTISSSSIVGVIARGTFLVTSSLVVMTLLLLLLLLLRLLLLLLSLLFLFLRLLLLLLLLRLLLGGLLQCNGRACCPQHARKMLETA